MILKEDFLSGADVHHDVGTPGDHWGPTFQELDSCNTRVNLHGRMCSFVFEFKKQRFLEIFVEIDPESDNPLR